MHIHFKNPSLEIHNNMRYSLESRKANNLTTTMTESAITERIS